MLKSNELCHQCVQRGLFQRQTTTRCHSQMKANSITAVSISLMWVWARLHSKAKFNKKYSSSCTHMNICLQMVASSVPINAEVRCNTRFLKNPSSRGRWTLSYKQHFQIAWLCTASYYGKYDICLWCIFDSSQRDSLNNRLNKMKSSEVGEAIFMRLIVYCCSLWNAFLHNILRVF